MANPLSNITGGVVGAGVGIAAANIAEAVLEVERQQAWQDNAYRVLDLGALAELVAQGLIDRDAAAAEAKRNGFSRNKLMARVHMAQTAPQVEQALELWRRGKIGSDLARHALEKAKIDSRYHDALLDLYNERLDPAVVAAAVQRGILADAKDPETGEPLLPVGAPTRVGKVPPMPSVDLSPLAEARASGYDFDRLAVLTRLVGLPPGPGELLQLINRGKITRDDFLRGVAEGNTRNEWADVLYELRHAVVPAADYAGLRLRGWLTPQESYDGGRLSGYSPEQMDLLYLNRGRPPAPGEMWQLVNRNLADRDDFTRAVKESDIRSEWEPQLWELRHPVLTAAEYAGLHLRAWISEAEMNEGGALTGHTPEQMHLMFLNRGRPISPTQAYTAWARKAPGPYGGTFDRGDFDKAIAQSDIRPEYADALWHDRFNYPSLFQLRQAVTSGALTAARARTILGYMRYEDQDADALIAAWQKGSSGSTKDLTRAQLATEYEGLHIDRAEYLRRLEAIGYSAAEAGQLADLADTARVARARNQRISRIHNQYVGHKISQQAALIALDDADVRPAARDLILTEWEAEREVNVRRLTQAQVKKAYTRSLRTREWALDTLTDQGMSEDEASLYLDQ